MPRRSPAITVERGKPSRSGMPSAKRLFSAWSRTSLFGMKSAWHDGPDEFGSSVCWACGWSFRDLDRCHVVPLEAGGSNEWSNLLLMCRACHLQSEGLPERLFWIWFFAMDQAAAQRRRFAGLEPVIAELDEAEDADLVRKMLGGGSALG